MIGYRKLLTNHMSRNFTLSRSGLLNQTYVIRVVPNCVKRAEWQTTKISLKCYMVTKLNQNIYRVNRTIIFSLKIHSSSWDLFFKNKCRLKLIFKVPELKLSKKGNFISGLYQNRQTFCNFCVIHLAWYYQYSSNISGITLYKKHLAYSITI